MVKRYRKKDGKQKVGGFNWFDRLLFLVIAIGAVAAFFTVRYLQKRAEGDGGILTYTLLLSDVDPTAMQLDNSTLPITVGDPVRSQNGTISLGQVTEIRHVPHRTAAVQNGTITFMDARDRFDYYITVTAQASKRTGDGIRVGDIRIAAGPQMSLRIGPYYAADAQVISVKWEDLKDA